MGPAMLAALPAAISGAGSIIGGIFGSSSAAEQNREERAWQERMAATQYQRAVHDMRAAGLNPLMLYGKGAMSAPVTGGARMDESVGVREGVRGASGAMIQALGLMEMKARINDLNSAAAAKMADKDLKDAQAGAVEQTKLIEWNDWLGKNPDGIMTGWGALQRKKAEQDIAESVARASNMSAQEAEARARAALLAVEERMLKYKESFAQAWQKYWDQVGVLGAYAEVGGKLFTQVAGTLGVNRIADKILNPGQKNGGAASAKQAERMQDVFDFNNNQSDMIGR